MGAEALERQSGQNQEFKVLVGYSQLEASVDYLGPKIKISKRLYYKAVHSVPCSGVPPSPASMPAYHPRLRAHLPSSFFPLAQSWAKPDPPFPGRTTPTQTCQRPSGSQDASPRSHPRRAAQ